MLHLIMCGAGCWLALKMDDICCLFKLSTVFPHDSKPPFINTFVIVSLQSQKNSK